MIFIYIVVGQDGHLSYVGTSYEQAKKDQKEMNELHPYCYYKLEVKTVSTFGAEGL